MLQALVGTARGWLHDLRRIFLRSRVVRSQPLLSSPPPPLQRLERVLLTDGVGRTLFEGFAAHRAEARGEEETGWLLMGLRDAREAIVLATLPAGAEREASVSHVRFNTGGQVMGSRMVRQLDRRLTIVGVVHTHPGSLRHPSDGDYAGDSQWVGHLRGGEGVFGIGTADGLVSEGTIFAHQPRPHLQCMGELCLSWYTLGKEDANYRPLQVDVTLGPDLARPLHPVWPLVETHADQLDRLYRQQAGVTFDVVGGKEKPGLAVSVPLAEPGMAVRVVMREEDVRYFLVRNGELYAADCPEKRIDRGVYLLLAALAARE